MEKAYYVILAVILAWCIAIFITPLLTFCCKNLAGLSYLFFHFICHQLPERSFFLLGKQLPVCARCTGIYLGALAGVLIYPVKRFVASKKLLLIASVPVVLDGIEQLIGFWESTNLLRLTSGLLLGLVAILFILPELINFLTLLYMKFRKLI